MKSSANLDYWAFLFDGAVRQWDKALDERDLARDECAEMAIQAGDRRIERDQARDWCRMLVAVAKTMIAPFAWDRYADYTRAYAALPPELQAAIEE